MKKLFILTLVLTGFSVAVSAQQASDESFRQHRITKGYKSGELTRPEMRRLHREHKIYKMEKHRALRDGKISRRERHHLNKIHRHDSRKIYRYKHNRRHRVI